MYIKLNLNPWLIIILVIALFSYSCAVWWGLPGEIDWAVDSVSPQNIINGDWTYPYPPFHRYLLYILYFPWVLSSQLGWVDLSSIETISLMTLLGRFLSVLMSVGIVYSVFLIGLEIFNKQLPSLLSASCVLGIVSLVYYGKTMNVEVPYVFWFSWAMVFYIRAIKCDKSRDYLLFIISATLSVCTKDQAYGLFILPAIFLVYNNLKQRNNTRKTRWGFDLITKIFFPFIIGVIIFVLLHNILFDFTAFTDHLERLSSASYEANQVLNRPQHNLQEHSFVFYRFFRDIQFNFGWPLFIISLLSIILCFFRKQEKYLLLCLLIPCLSYYLLFISVILYSRDRFLLPICLILCLFCGDLLANFIQNFYQAKKLKITLVTVVLIYSFFYANSINILMIQDSRYRAENWIRQNITTPSTVGYVGFPQYHPRFEKFPNITTKLVYPDGLLGAVEEQKFAYIITTSGYSLNRFPQKSKKYQGFKKLYNTPSKYQLVFQYQSQPLWNLLNIEQSNSAEFYDKRFKTGNFNKINPEINIFKKVE